MRTSGASASLRVARARSSRSRVIARSSSAGASSAVDVGTTPARPSTAPPTRGRPINRAARTALARRRSIASVTGAPSAVASVTVSSANRARLALQHEHADHRAAADQRHADERREVLLAEPGDVLVPGLGGGALRRHGSHALGDQPGDALADGERGRADRRGREAVVAAHHQLVVLADVDAGDVDAGDRGDLVAHRGQHGLDRTVVAGELDQPEDAVDAARAARAAVMHSHVVGHATIVGSQRGLVDVVRVEVRDHDLDVRRGDLRVVLLDHALDQGAALQRGLRRAAVDVLEVVALASRSARTSSSRSRAGPPSPPPARPDRSRRRARPSPRASASSTSGDPA